MQEAHYLVPHNNEGTATDIVYSVLCDMVEEAEDLFVDAKDRLLDVGNWAKYAYMGSVQFGLADSHQHVVSRHARRGDHILISDPCAGTGSLDWFTINALEYDDYPDDNLETFAIRLSSTKEQAESGVADTAIIVIERKGEALSATFHGRNNVTAEQQSWQGLIEPQWAALMKGLIEYYD
jgi:hypothetical protein